MKTSLQQIRERHQSCYKEVVRAVIRNQIQYLVEQLNSHVGDETLILTASLSDGTLSELGSSSVQGFIHEQDDIKSAFMSYCKNKAIKRVRQRERPFKGTTIESGVAPPNGKDSGTEECIVIKQEPEDDGFAEQDSVIDRFNINAAIEPDIPSKRKRTLDGTPVGVRHIQQVVPTNVHLSQSVPVPISRTLPSDIPISQSSPHSSGVHPMPLHVPISTSSVPQALHPSVHTATPAQSITIQPLVQKSASLESVSVLTGNKSSNTMEEIPGKALQQASNKSRQEHSKDGSHLDLAEDFTEGADSDLHTDVQSDCNVTNERPEVSEDVRAQMSLFDSSEQSASTGWMARMENSEDFQSLVVERLKTLGATESRLPEGTLTKIADEFSLTQNTVKRFWRSHLEGLKSKENADSEDVVVIQPKIEIPDEEFEGESGQIQIFRTDDHGESETFLTNEQGMLYHVTEGSQSEWAGDNSLTNQQESGAESDQEWSQILIHKDTDIRSKARIVLDIRETGLLDQDDKEFQHRSGLEKLSQETEAFRSVFSGSQTESELTKRKTNSDVQILRNYMMAYAGEFRELHTIPVTELEKHIRSFLLNIKKKDGGVYEPSSLKAFYSSFDRHLRSLDYETPLATHSIFWRCRQLLKQKMKAQKAKKRKTVLISEEELEILYQEGQLGCVSPESITNSLWYVLVEHFGLKTGRELHGVKWGDVACREDKNGQEYLIYTQDEKMKSPQYSNPTAAEKQAVKVQPTVYGKPEMPERDPVAIYKLYKTLRPVTMMQPEAPFFLSVNSSFKTNLSKGKVLWFKPSPMGINRLYETLHIMKKNAGLPVKEKKFFTSDQERFGIVSSSGLSSTSAPPVFQHKRSPVPLYLEPAGNFDGAQDSHIPEEESS